MSDTLPLLDEPILLLSSRGTDFLACFAQTNGFFFSLQWAAWTEQLLARLEQQRVFLNDHNLPQPQAPSKGSWCSRVSHAEKDIEMHLFRKQGPVNTTQSSFY